ncbi:hypothetical protein M2475_000858 [Breznakia sp. PF5-3]|uniref:hypothetical protein n=1 Tax=unclassified Breznakia TaxID=2623764 RepID=UPI002404B2F3|nr:MULTISPECIES: hypothetical protein [unclassified Breznakia]MDF9824507.1 hypothetical protein [Breznakia sp. PM6-1]MDF9835293.1 hypothetical protein [Breznakia sp. PF5-3]MDF9837009.1 hypothetical protein [Breznakia sp. PFB2-8]MDF9858934.1 hypothetical protein [Breznakia sp. PH5-24]
MEYEITLEKLNGDLITLKDEKELEDAINNLMNEVVGTCITIEIESPFDKIIMLMVDCVEVREKGMFKKNKVIDAYYRIHAVADIDEDSDLINYYYKTKSCLEVQNMFLDFMNGKGIPTVYSWAKDEDTDVKQVFEM